MSEQIAIDYLNTVPRLYVVDGYAGWDPKYRQKIRIVCTRAYHALFMRNMLIKPTAQELKKDFLNGEPDFHVFNAGELLAPYKHIPGLNSPTSVQLNFSEN